MSLRPLIIGDPERQAIAALIEKAAANVTPLGVVMALAATREGGTQTNMANESYSLVIPRGYHVTYTHEQQERGVCRHMSVSVESASMGMAPSVAAVNMLAEVFGFINRAPRVISWLDRMEDGTPIVNLLEPLDGDMAHWRRPDDE